MEKMSLVIDGMSCAHCVASVKQALAATPGVRVDDVSVGRRRRVRCGRRDARDDRSGERRRVSGARRWCAMTLIDWLVIGCAAAAIAIVNWYFFIAVARSRADAPRALAELPMATHTHAPVLDAPSQGANRIRIPVSGMTCAACQARVQSALARQPGVDDASVNLMMETAAVTFDPGVATPDADRRAIRDTGYGAELPADDVVAAPGARGARSLAARGAARDHAQGDRERRRGRARDGAPMLVLPMLRRRVSLALPFFLLALTAS